MIITKTPYRISLFGGGTDHPSWYKKHGGEVISFAIDKYCYISTRILPPFFDHKYRIAYSKVETVNDFKKILHPVVREAIRKFSPNLSLEIHHDGDLPARTGIGSSSAFTVGLINSLLILQDKIACTLGGMNYIEFGGNLNWEATPMVLSSNFQKSITDRIVMIYTGITRISSDIQANLLVDLEKKLTTMQRTTELTRQCRKILEEEGDLDLIGEMLVESWSLKREMNNLAITPALDDIWEKAKSAGALGGKVLGAGGGGFCMFWVKENGREEFLNNFNLGTYVPVRISDTGSTCVLK